MSLGRVLGFSLFVVFSALPALADRLATVSTERAFVYELPDRASSTDMTLLKGTAVNVTGEMVKGFYPIETMEGQDGWIERQEIQLESDTPREASPTPTPAPSLEPSPRQFEEPSDEPSPEPTSTPEPKPALKASPSSPEERWGLDVMAFGGADFISMSEMNQLLGTSLFNTAIYYGLELDYALNRRWGLILRAEKISASSSIESTSFSLSALPVSVGASYDLIDKGKFKLQAAALLGYASGVQLTENASGFPSPNVTQFSSSAMMEMLRINADYKISDLLSLYAEAGYRLLKTSSVPPSQTGNGGTLFQSNGSYASIPLNLDGPVLGVGVVFNF